MRYGPRTAILLSLCGLTACAPHIEISRAALPCSDLVPNQLSDDVEGAALPDDFNDKVQLQAFGDAQTGQLEKANAYKGASLAIVKRCEQRDREIDATLASKPWWRFWQ